MREGARSIDGLNERRPWVASGGRTLSDEDVAHYQKIVVALNETICIMAEIDEVIEAHGGWPGAFRTGADAASEVTANVLEYNATFGGD